MRLSLNNKTRFAVLLLLVILVNSCALKQKKTIAIDVLLTLPESIYSQTVQLNEAIRKNNPATFQLDENHIPHITLLQCYIVEADLPKVKNKLKGLYKTIKNETLVANSLHYSKEKDESFASIEIEKSEPLLKLHGKIIALLKPYMVANGSQKSYVQNPDGSPIDQFTIDYVPEFVNKHSFKNYDPHISLGVAKTNVLDSLAASFKPIGFRATSVSVYQLGDSGTARKQL
jgi:hypothetical protein